MFKEMGLRVKLVMAFLSVAFLGLIVGAVGIYGLREIGDDFKEVVYSNIPRSTSLAIIREAQTATDGAENALLYEQMNKKEADEFFQKMEQFISAVEVARKNFESADKNEAATNLWKNDFAPEWSAWIKDHDDFVKLAKEFFAAEPAQRSLKLYERMVEQALVTNYKSFNPLKKTLLKLTEITNAENNLDSDKAEQRINFLKILMLVTIIVALFFSVLLGFLVSGSTLRTLGADPNKISEIVRRVTEGDTSIELDSNINIGVYADLKKMVFGFSEKAKLATIIASGDFTQTVKLASDKDTLGLALQNMVKKLRETFEGFLAISTSVSGGAGQVASASQSLSQGATEQAASLEEISSSVNEIGSRTRITAENASKATGMASDSCQFAELGKAKIQTTLDSMIEINDSSMQISKIIKTIDDIAFQTNLLALNAAVEAARAGKHGKGFAVVSEEVRNLAGRSSKAAQETAQLIEASVAKVANGLAVAKDTATSFNDIYEGAVKILKVFEEISQATEEQALGVTQISQGLTQMEQVTQQAAAGAEETAAAAKEMSGQTIDLQKKLSQFKI